MRSASRRRGGGVSLLGGGGDGKKIYEKRRRLVSSLSRASVIHPQARGRSQGRAGKTSTAMIANASFERDGDHAGKHGDAQREGSFNDVGGEMSERTGLIRVRWAEAPKKSGGCRLVRRKTRWRTAYQHGIPGCRTPIPAQARYKLAITLKLTSPMGALSADSLHQVRTHRPAIVRPSHGPLTSQGEPGGGDGAEASVPSSLLHAAPGCQIGVQKLSSSQPLVLK